MTTSGTYAYNPAFSELTLAAFGMIQLRPSELTAEHLFAAQTQANMIMVKLSNRNPYQYTLVTQSIPLIKGTASYSLPAQTISVSIATIRTTDSLGNTTDRVLGPFSDTEYAAVPNKAQQAIPTTYWFQLSATPQITLWPTPDLNATYTLMLNSFRQLQDAAFPLGQTPDLPYRFFECFQLGLAAKLALLFRPEAHDRLKSLFEESFKEVSIQDEQNVNIYITPGLGGYWI